MTFALSGTVITQSGTDANSSGLNGNGATQSSPWGASSGLWFIYRQQTVAQNNQISVTGTWTLQGSREAVVFNNGSPSPAVSPVNIAAGATLNITGDALVTSGIGSPAPGLPALQINITGTSGPAPITVSGTLQIRDATILVGIGTTTQTGDPSSIVLNSGSSFQTRGAFATIRCGTYFANYAANLVVRQPGILDFQATTTVSELTLQVADNQTSMAGLQMIGSPAIVSSFYSANSQGPQGPVYFVDFNPFGSDSAAGQANGSHPVFYNSGAIWIINATAGTLIRQTSQNFSNQTLTNAWNVGAIAKRIAFVATTPTGAALPNATCVMPRNWASNPPTNYNIASANLNTNTVPAGVPIRFPTNANTLFVRSGGSSCTGVITAPPNVTSMGTLTVSNVVGAICVGQVLTYTGGSAIVMTQITATTFGVLPFIARPSYTAWTVASTTMTVTATDYVYAYCATQTGGQIVVTYTRGDTGRGVTAAGAEVNRAVYQLYGYAPQVVNLALFGLGSAPANYVASAVAVTATAPAAEANWSISFPGTAPNVAPLISVAANATNIVNIQNLFDQYNVFMSNTANQAMVDYYAAMTVAGSTLQITGLGTATNPSLTLNKALANSTAGGGLTALNAISLIGATATLTLTARPSTAGTYPAYSANTISLGSLNTPVYQSLTATTYTGLPNNTGLLGAGGSFNGGSFNATVNGALPSTGGTLNCAATFVTSSPGNLISFTGTNLGGTITISISDAQNYPIQLSGCTLVANLTINRGGVGTGNIQVLLSTLNLNGFTITYGTGVAVQNAVVVNSDTANGGGLVSIYNGNNLVASGSPNTQVFTVYYSGSATAVVWSQAGFQPLTFAGNSTSINVTHTAAYSGWSAPTTNLFTTSASAGFLTLTTATGTGNVPATAGTTTLQSLVGIFGTADFNQGVAYALQGGFTLAQFLVINDGSNFTLNTALLQFRSSPNTNQYFLGGLNLGGTVTPASITALIPGSGNANQITFIANAILGVATVIPAVEGATAGQFAKLDAGVRSASLLIPYAGNTYP